MKYICFLLPAFIALDYTKKNRKKPIELIIDYGKYVSIINVLVLLLLMMVGKSDQFLNDSGSIRFYFLYLLASIVVAYFVPRVINYCRNNININIKRVNNEKKKNNK